MTSSIRDRQALNKANQREKLMKTIKDEFQNFGHNHTKETEQKYIMLIGRTRTGKSTIKTLLKDPTAQPKDLTLKSETKDATLDSSFLHENNIVLNILDTPGLFERAGVDENPRDNESILSTIKICVEREVTQFHVICFCASITDGINKEDIEAIKLLRNFLGEEIAENSCLIVTRCESKSEQQRDRIQQELQKDKHFVELKSYFRLGIYFSGALNYDDYNNGSDSLLDQFIVISDYREKLIKLFTGDIKPVPISNILLGDYKNELQQKKQQIHSSMFGPLSQQLKQLKEPAVGKNKGICRAS